ncbi:MAG TPA: Crp/Fnr family transcriptional regulator [Pyrinomonadaceae bacterium]|nr:Crp/Fnr family transcriptional regulator [Pyrinomonadaceae bacterium]
MSSLNALSTPTRNRILNALPPEEFERLSAYLEPVELMLGEVLYRPNEPITHVYFPNVGTVSIVCQLEDGKSVEAGMVGNEGMFGVCVFLGSVTSPLQAVVQLPGNALRMRADVLRAEFKRGEHLQDLLLRYTQAFIIQIAQTAACNRIHPIDGRLARWLLMCQDRAASGELQLTHEFIAVMLGTRRAGVSEAAAKLQDEGIIRYRRGHVSILNRHGMEGKSCECYPVVKKEFDRLLGGNGRVW